MDIEQPQLIAFGPRFTAFEEVPGFGGRTRHERNASRVNNWKSQGISLSPGQRRGDMTLRDCKEGLGLNVSSRPLGRIGQRHELGWRPYLLVALLAAASLFFAKLTRQKLTLS